MGRKRYRSYTQEEIDLYAEDGLRPPESASTGAVAEKMTLVQQTEFLSYVKEGRGFDKICQLMNFPYNKFRNTYWDEFDNSFRISVDSAMRLARQEIEQLVYDGAVGRAVERDPALPVPDKEAQFELLKRWDVRSKLLHSHIERKKDRIHREKLVRMQIEGRADVESLILQMLPVFEEACIRMVGPEKTSLIMKATKMGIYERVVPNDQQIAIECSSTSLDQDDEGY